MRKLFMFAAAFAFLQMSAQNPAENPGTLPSIVPPSPEVASLTKAGLISAGLHTGAANASIPLYTVKVGSISLPISLSYSTNGTRVNDIPSRVGLGWNLVAGGTINRTIHDEEDGATSTIWLNPVNFNSYDQTLLNYVQQANLEHYDTEKDEFSFSVTGISGKFFLDGNGVPRISDHSNVVITNDGNSFTLITAEGIKYEFGKNVELEKTRDIKTNGSNRTSKIKTTAWFLTRIVSTEGDQINFHYSPIYTKSKLGPYQSVILKTTQQGYPGHPVPACAALCAGQWAPYGVNQVDYDTYYINKITTSNGLQVYFNYQDRRMQAATTG